MPAARRAAAVGAVVALGALLSGAAAAGPAGTVTIEARIASVEGRLHLTGAVAGSRSEVVVYRASACEVTATGAVACDFERYRTVPQDRDGGFAVPLQVPQKAGLGKAFFWQARVPGADTEVWRTYRLEP